MTPQRERAVERYDLDQGQGYDAGGAFMYKIEEGDWVRAEDFDAERERAIVAEGLLERTKEFYMECAAWCQTGYGPWRKCDCGCEKLKAEIRSFLSAEGE